MELTDKQQERLKKLDDELARKHAYEERSRERRIASAAHTGIPLDIVDSDVVKLGTMLGLITSLDVFEGRQEPEKRFSLLDAFMNGGGDDVKTFNYAALPPYFFLSDQRGTEVQKNEWHQQFVRLECERFSRFVSDTIRRDMDAISDLVSITLTEQTLEAYVQVIKDTIDVVFEELAEEDDDELWDQLHTLRNCLLGPVSICEYKDLVAHHIYMLEKHGKSPERILRHLSYIDANLTLYPGFEKTRKTDTFRIGRELTIRTHIKNPELVSFSLSAILKECCVASLMFEDVKAVLRAGVVGPYRNNPVCFMSSMNGFYVMKRKTDDGLRMWVLDNDCTVFSERLRSAVLKYTCQLYRTFIQEITAARPRVTTSAIAVTLKQNIAFLHRPAAFRRTVCEIITDLSSVIPTEADVFDEAPRETDGEAIALASNIAVPKEFW